MSASGLTGAAAAAAAAATSAAASTTASASASSASASVSTSASAESSWRIGADHALQLMYDMSSQGERVLHSSAALDALVTPHGDAAQLQRLVRSEAHAGNPHAICCLGVFVYCGWCQAYDPVDTAIAAEQARGLDAAWRFVADCEDVQRTRGDACAAKHAMARDANPFHPLWTASDALALFDLAASLGSVTARVNALICTLNGFARDDALMEAADAERLRAFEELQRERQAHPKHLGLALAEARVLLWGVPAIPVASDKTGRKRIVREDYDAVSRLLRAEPLHSAFHCASPHPSIALMHAVLCRNGVGGVMRDCRRARALYESVAHGHGTKQSQSHTQTPRKEPTNAANDGAGGGGDGGSDDVDASAHALRVVNTPARVVEEETNSVVRPITQGGHRSIALRVLVAGLTWEHDRRGAGVMRAPHGGGAPVQADEPVEADDLYTRAELGHRHTTAGGDSKDDDDDAADAAARPYTRWWTLIGTGVRLGAVWPAVALAAAYWQRRSPWTLVQHEDAADRLLPGATRHDWRAVEPPAPYSSVALPHVQREHQQRVVAWTMRAALSGGDAIAQIDASSMVHTTLSPWEQQQTAALWCRRAAATVDTDAVRLLALYYHPGRSHADTDQLNALRVLVRTGWMPLHMLPTVQNGMGRRLTAAERFEVCGCVPSPAITLALLRHALTLAPGDALVQWELGCLMFEGLYERESGAAKTGREGEGVTVADAKVLAGASTTTTTTANDATAGASASASAQWQSSPVSRTLVPRHLLRAVELWRGSGVAAIPLDELSESDVSRAAEAAAPAAPDAPDDADGDPFGAAAVVDAAARAADAAAAGAPDTSGDAAFAAALAAADTDDDL